LASSRPVLAFRLQWQASVKAFSGEDFISMVFPPYLATLTGK
jgi:hypothetical protein